MEMITLIIRAIVMIAFVLAPTQIIMMGPSATFGREFKTVKKGSNISAKNLLSYITTLRINAIKIPKVNDNNTSPKVTPKWTKISPVSTRETKVLIIFDGEENIKLLIMPVFAPYSHNVSKTMIMII